MDDEHRRPVDVRPLIDSCLNVAWGEIRRRAQLVRDLEPVAAVLGDEGRLSQVFLNLILNAAQSIAGGRPEEHQVRVATRTLPDGRVAIEVRDTGAGIAPDHLPRIFDPFFTTKGPGSGTGLGLSICHAVVTAMGGTIEVESVPGHGSTFRVLLAPIAPEVARHAGFPTPPPPPRRARVLVVDDEPLVGTVLRRTLLEHDVTVVESGRAAIDRISSGERYDVVLSDLLMPEISGMDLYREVTASWPDLAGRFVFLTGGAFTPAAREFLESEKVEWVEKPFDVAALRAAVARRVAPPASA
jgi:CheY-like chemotaxis protein